MTIQEVCSKRGRLRPFSIYDPSCSSGGYCEWGESKTMDQILLQQALSRAVKSIEVYLKTGRQPSDVLTILLIPEGSRRRLLSGATDHNVGRIIATEYAESIKTEPEIITASLTSYHTPELPEFHPHPRPSADVIIQRSEHTIKNALAACAYDAEPVDIRDIILAACDSLVAVFTEQCGGQVECFVGVKTRPGYRIGYGIVKGGELVAACTCDPRRMIEAYLKASGR